MADTTTTVTQIGLWMRQLIESEIHDAFAAEAAGEEQTEERVRARATAVATAIRDEVLRGMPQDDGYVIPRGMIPDEFIAYARQLRRRLTASETARVR